jgi:serine/threonine protein kinase
MGQVWKAAIRASTGQWRSRFRKERFSERFEREARAIASLNHPHICTLFDVGADYLVMEYVDGKPFAEPLPTATTLLYGIQIAQALDAAHRLGIVHRDLKPANILIIRLSFEITCRIPGTRLTSSMAGSGGRIVAEIASPAEWAHRIGLIDPHGGKFSLIPVNFDGETLAPVWTRDGKTLAMGSTMGFNIWRFHAAR